MRSVTFPEAKPDPRCPCKRGPIEENPITLGTICCDICGEPLCATCIESTYDVSSDGDGHWTTTAQCEPCLEPSSDAHFLKAQNDATVEGK